MTKRKVRAVLPLVDEPQVLPLRGMQRCERLAATLTVEACATRSKRARLVGAHGMGGGRFESCVGCAIGRSNARKISEAAVDGAA